MRFLVDFKQDATSEQIDSYFQTNGCTVIKTFNKFEKIYLVEMDNDPVSSDILENFVRDDDNPIKLLSTTFYFNGNYGKNLLTGDVVDISMNDQNDWWKIYCLNEQDFDKDIEKVDRRGDGVTVYVLDSGIKTDHPDFVGAKVSNLWSFTDDHSTPNDTNGHGTAIASLIAGRTCGLTNADVKGVKIFQKDVGTMQSDLVAALDAIFTDYIENLETGTSRGAIVNCSWTIDRNLFIESKIQQMIDAGMLFVAAAGNNGLPIDNVTPASMKDVLTIGAYNSDLKPCSFSDYTGNSITSLSHGDTNYGELDGWAPGENIYVAKLDNTFGYADGTSMAAGIHSAVVAFMLSIVYIEISSGYEPAEFLSIASLRRENLLDLDDPKYASSVNKVSTVFISLPPRGVTYSFLSKENVGRMHTLNVFDPTIYERVELQENLPGDLKFLDNGKLIGRVYQMSDPSKEYELVKVPLKVFLRSGESEEYELEILTVREDLDMRTLEVEDQLIQIKLAQTQCSWGGCADPNQGCADQCGFFCDPINDFTCPSKLRCQCV